MSGVRATLSQTARRLPVVGPAAVRRLSLVSLVCVGAIVLTGAAVRLTGSGLGCADWPACTKTHLTPPLQYHSLIEFGNRMVTILLVVIIGTTFLATVRRRPFRRDLAWLSGGLIAGVILEAVLGGLLVYSKLNPYLLIVHFLATMLLLVDAVVLLHRAGHDYSSEGRLLVPRPMLLLTRGVVAFLAIVIAAGAATTAAAPDAGGAVGQLVAKRLPIELRSIAELHATLALFFVGVVLSLAVALHAMDVPERIRRAARMLVVVLVLQAAIGYSQYFTHLPAALVELHELGLTAIVIGVVQFFLALTYRAPERAPARLRAVPSLRKDVAPAPAGAVQAADGGAGTVLGATSLDPTAGPAHGRTRLGGTGAGPLAD